MLKTVTKTNNENLLRTKKNRDTDNILRKNISHQALKKLKQANIRNIDAEFANLLKTAPHSVKLS